LGDRVVFVDLEENATESTRLGVGQDLAEKGSGDTGASVCGCYDERR